MDDNVWQAMYTCVCVMVDRRKNHSHDKDIDILGNHSLFIVT